MERQNLQGVRILVCDMFHQRLVQSTLSPGALRHSLDFLTVRRSPPWWILPWRDLVNCDGSWLTACVDLTKQGPMTFQDSLRSHTGSLTPDCSIQSSHRLPQVQGTGYRRYLYKHWHHHPWCSENLKRNTQKTWPQKEETWKAYWAEHHCSMVSYRAEKIN